MDGRLDGWGPPAKSNQVRTEYGISYTGVGPDSAKHSLHSFASSIRISLCLVFVFAHHAALDPTHRATRKWV